MKTDPRYIESGKWDEKTIDAVYESQLDQIGGILDQIQISVFSALLDANEILATVRQLFEQMERELLLQWRIKQDGGLEELFNRQKYWLNQELRLSDGVLALWKRFCMMALRVLTAPATMLDQNPWRSTVLAVMVKLESYGDLSGILASSLRDQLLRDGCLLFRSLYELSPYHQTISFLNLIEIGTGERPEICDPGEMEKLDSGNAEQPMYKTVLADLDKPESWDNMAARLLTYWEQDKGDGAKT